MEENNFGKFTFIDFKSKKDMNDKHESIEQFLSRGGKIQKINTKEVINERIKKDSFSGEHVGTSKLTEKIVKEIRKSTKSNKELAEEYGVNISSINKVKARISWTHVRDDD